MSAGRDTMRKFRTIGPATVALIFGAFCLLAGLGIGALIGWAT